MYRDLSLVEVVSVYLLDTDVTVLGALCQRERTSVKEPWLSILQVLVCSNRYFVLQLKSQLSLKSLLKIQQM